MTGIAKLFSDIASILDGLYGNIKFSLTKNVTGLDDANYVGVFSGNVPSTSVIIAIDGNGTPDTFSFTYGSNTQANIPIMSGDMDLVDGIKINFGATTGHTIGDSWTLNITSEKLLKTIRLWNNQIQVEKEGKYADFAKPACFIEFSNLNLQTLGGGQQQIFDDMLVTIHLCHEFYDAQDGNFEQDLPVFEIKQRIYAALQRQKNTMAVILNRDSEEVDYDHDNIIHYKMVFKTNQVDDTVLIPDGYIIKYPDTNLIFSIENKTHPTPLVVHYFMNRQSANTFLGFEFTFLSENTNGYIDWGDSSPIEQFTGAGFTISISHQYINVGIYHARIYFSNPPLFNELSDLNADPSDATQITFSPSITDLQKLFIGFGRFTFIPSLPLTLTELQFSQQSLCTVLDLTPYINLTKAIVAANPLATSLNISGLNHLNRIEAQGCALTITEVSNALIEADSWNTNNLYIDLSAQTPSAHPNIAGLAAKVSIISRGGTVFTD